jgi:NitT/TauT family transport system ATP-binding protein
MNVTVPQTVTTDEKHAALSARGLWKCYPHQKSYATVLNDVDLDIEQGEFVTIVGPSGCGKSTLLAILAGLDDPTTGRVTAHGHEVDGTVPDSAFVFQRDLLLEWRSVLDNVLLPYQLRGEPTQPHRDRARQLLSMVGLEGSESRFPWQLSGGMRQRVAICRALIGNPDVLFMDEPFGALDALTRERLNDDLLQLCALDRRKTVAFVTHDVAEAVYLGDRVIVMGAKPGRIFADIRVDLPRPRVPEVRDTLEFASLNALVRSALRDEEELRSAMKDVMS